MRELDGELAKCADGHLAVIRRRSSAIQGRRVGQFGDRRGFGNTGTDGSGLFKKAMSLLVVERDLFPEKRTGMRREIEGYGSDQSICANQDSWEDNA